MQYRRAYADGATYYFTLNLLDRQSDLLIKNIIALRYAFFKTKQTHPFSTDGVVYSTYSKKIRTAYR